MLMKWYELVNVVALLVKDMRDGYKTLTTKTALILFVQNVCSIVLR